MLVDDIPSAATWNGTLNRLPANTEAQPHSEPPSRQQPFRFLDLPGEIRNVIYEYMLALAPEHGVAVYNAIGQTFFERKLNRHDYGGESRGEATFKTAVPLQRGFHAPWTTWLFGRDSTGEDRITFNARPAILAVSRTVSREASGLWLRQPLLFELHDVRRWRDYRVSDRVALLRAWVARQEPAAIEAIAAIRIAVNYEVEDDHGTEPVERAVGRRRPGRGLAGTEHDDIEADDDNHDDDVGWLRDQRVLFDIARTPSGIVVRAGCALAAESEARLRVRLDDAFGPRKSRRCVFSGADLFTAAEWVETMSCVDELRLRATENDCLTADGRDYYLAYRTWTVVAVVESGGEAVVEGAGAG